MTEIPAHLLARAQAAREKGMTSSILPADGSANNHNPIPTSAVPGPQAPDPAYTSREELRKVALMAAATYQPLLNAYNSRSVNDVIADAKLFEKYLLGKL